MRGWAVAILLVAASAHADDAAPAPAEAPASPQRLGTQKTVAAVTMGAGGASFVLGTIFGVAAITAWGNAEATCGPGCSSTSPAQTDKSHATTYATVSTVGFVAGSVLLVGGIAIWFTAPSSGEPRPAAPPPGVAPVVAAVGVVPSVGGLSVVGRF
jgi:hypothetical protein